MTVAAADFRERERGWERVRHHPDCISPDEKRPGPEGPGHGWVRVWCCDQGTVADHPLVSPDSKPSAKGSKATVENEKTSEAVPAPQTFSAVTRHT